MQLMIAGRSGPTSPIVISPTRRKWSEMLNFRGAEAFSLFRAALKASSP